MEEDKEVDTGTFTTKPKGVPELKEPEKIPDESATTLKELREERSKLEEATAASAKQLARVEAFEVEKTLAGESSTNHPPKKTKDELADEQARKFLKGTGYGEELFPNVNDS